MERGCWTGDRQYPSATPSAVLVKTEHFSNCPLLFSKQAFALSPPWAAKKKEESTGSGENGAYDRAGCATLSVGRDRDRGVAYANKRHRRIFDGIGL